jgi:hypothetical protein
VFAKLGGPEFVPADPERRLFFARLFGGAVAATAGVAGAAGVASALGRVGVKEVEIQLSRLPQAMDRFTIVQLTDVHIGPTLGRDFVEEVVAQTNALQPDLIAITGDLVDGTVGRLREAVAPLAQLRARHGVYFVTGNHEFYTSMDPEESASRWMEELERIGIRVLRNERVAIGDGEASFDLAGVHDWNATRYAPAHAPDLQRAVEGRDPARELVLLAHQPRHIAEAKKHGVGLQLSGHTHGGQIWPFRFLVRLAQPFVAGLGRRGDTQIYVSRGTGFFGPPMRVAEPAEISKIVLRSAAA